MLETPVNHKLSHLWLLSQDLHEPAGLDVLDMYRNIKMQLDAPQSAGPNHERVLMLELEKKRISPEKVSLCFYLW
jgi:hypothetical protein